MHGLGFGVPVVKGSRDTNVPGREMGEFEANRFKLRPVAHEIVVILVVVHKFFSCFDPASLRADAHHACARSNEFFLSCQLFHSQPCGRRSKPLNPRNFGVLRSPSMVVELNGNALQLA
jgi:hypothetical protein